MNAEHLGREGLKGSLAHQELLEWEHGTNSSSQVSPTLAEPNPSADSNTTVRTR